MRQGEFRQVAPPAARSNSLYIRISATTPFYTSAARCAFYHVSCISFFCQPHEQCYHMHYYIDISRQNGICRGDGAHAHRGIYRPPCRLQKIFSPSRYISPRMRDTVTTGRRFEAAVTPDYISAIFRIRETLCAAADLIFPVGSIITSREMARYYRFRRLAAF